MKKQSFQFLCQKITKKPLKTPLIVACSIFSLVSSGCSNTSQNEVQLEIQGIQRENSKGLYKVVGNTNLPESSRIAITAVRYLRPNAEETLSGYRDINRSILARQIVEVKQGKWEADLNLWQVAPNGNFQEPWQLNQDLKKLTPESEVTFVATFNPVGQLPSSGKQNFQQYQQLEGKSVRFTNEGEKYVQATQYRSIAMPVGKTTPPRIQAEFNDGWGNRYQIEPQSQNTRSSLPAISESQQTNSPPTASEFLR